MHSTHRSLAAVAQSTPSVRFSFLGEWAALSWTFRCHGLDMGDVEVVPVGKGSVGLNVVGTPSQMASQGWTEESFDFACDLYPAMHAAAERIE